MSGKIKEDWWTDFYRDFRPVFDLIPQRITNLQVRYLIEKLELRPGQHLLDCPCGVGRLSLPIARRGIRVTGVDLQPSYLAEVDQKARRAGLPIQLLLSDMRKLDFKSRFDAAANMWTSFGYFQRESDNQLVVNKMFHALKRGGKFLLHVINRDWIMANLQEADWYDLGEMKILERRQFDYRTSTMESIWTYLREGDCRSHRSWLRLYSYHELVRIFEKAGFVNIEGFGSVKDEPVNRTSRMLWVVGSKP
ncbi:MAG: methyltransferase domain-containing protein [bacterium]